MFSYFYRALVLFLVFSISFSSSSSNYNSTTSAMSANLSSSKFNAVLLLENHFQQLYNECNLQDYGMSYTTFKFGMTGFYNLRDKGLLSANRNHFTIIDFTKPSNEKRLFIIDLSTKKVVFNTYVAHGKKSGLIYARNFSNQHESYKSSLGFFKTGETYQGMHGYSLRLDGLEEGVNNNARSRAIVMHGADYVSNQFVNEHNRLGLSWGCPAISMEEHRSIIDYIKWGNCIFTYANDINYLNNSQFFNIQAASNYYIAK